MKNFENIIQKNIKPFFPRGTKVALFDFPNYSNVGDSAIWLGEIKFLDHCPDVEIVFCDSDISKRTYFPELSTDVKICINGGGNFGDLWPWNHQYRLDLIMHYKKNTIVQFPQSIFFKNDFNLNLTKEVINQHPDFNLFVRDCESLKIANYITKNRAMLCPDMALFLGALYRSTNPSYKILALMRDDIEAAITITNCFSSDVFITDWIIENTEGLIDFQRNLDAIHLNNPKLLQNLYEYKIKIYNDVAHQRIERGVEILSMGHVVITDRLHAHLICQMCGIPNIVIDNKYKKLSSFINTWGYLSADSYVADNIVDAILLAENLINER